MVGGGGLHVYCNRTTEGVERFGIYPKGKGNLGQIS